MRLTKTFCKKDENTKKGIQSRTKRDSMLKKKNKRRRRPAVYIMFLVIIFKEGAGVSFGS
jgi:hypothetical protein